VHGFHACVLQQNKVKVQSTGATAAPAAKAVERWSVPGALFEGVFAETVQMPADVDIRVLMSTSSTVASQQAYAHVCS
jgi:hypothetical protein